MRGGLGSRVVGVFAPTGDYIQATNPFLAIQDLRPSRTSAPALAALSIEAHASPMLEHSLLMM
jgi:hypothetical protein